MNAAELKEIFGRAVKDTALVQEIRIRAGKPVTVWIDGAEYMILKEGRLWRPDKEADVRLQEGLQERSNRVPAKEINCGNGMDALVTGDQVLIKEILSIFSRHSLYAFEDEIRQGFLTIEGGHRVGISGKAVLEGNAVRTIKDISSLNIRLAHEKIGCSDAVLPWLYENGELKNTLFLSPPGAGKTTILRDVIRQVSGGNRYGPGMEVSVVDERSEIGACFKGIPQCDLGIRTDVMDGCPKALGMVMMIRSMAPRVVAVDEIGTREDLEALRDVMKCGCKILATVHGNSAEDITKKPVLAAMAEEGMFSRYVVLKKTPRPGTVEGIYDEKLKKIEIRAQEQKCRGAAGAIHPEGDRA